MRISSGRHREPDRQALIDSQRPYREETEKKGRPEFLSDWIEAGRHWSRTGYSGAVKFFVGKREEE